MDQTERTTVRINKNLLKQTRDIAYNHGYSIQEVLNSLIAKGLEHYRDVKSRKEVVEETKRIQKILTKKGVNFSDILELSKKELK